MKSLHLIAALGLLSCGLDTSPQAGVRYVQDAGASEDDGLTPGGWPAKRHGSPADGKPDAASDTPEPEARDAAAGPSAPSAPGRAGAGGSKAAPAGGGAATPSGQGSTGSSVPGAASGPQNGSSSRAMHNAGGSATSGPSMDAGTKPGASASASDAAASDGAQGPADHAASSSGAVDAGSAASSPGSTRRNSGASSQRNGPAQSGGMSTAGSGRSRGNSANTLVGNIVDLVLAILDLSFGPIRPSEVENLVAAILVLSLSPPELVVDSLNAVLDALDATRICSEHPERCNPLCTNLESDCSVCGRDEQCIMRVEEMCRVQLPDNCR